jgi:hypothetical protein
LNVALTFTEVFPIGLVIALLSAGILRKNPRPPAVEPSLSDAPGMAK